MITKKTSRAPQSNPGQPINAGSSITSGVRNRQSNSISASTRVNLSEAQKTFVSQLQRNCRRNSSIMAATNTSNIMARPDFLELLPMFVQKLLILDVFGSVAMKSRQQLVPYFKFISEVDKGETAKGSILSSPFVNSQGKDPNFTGRAVKNEIVDTAGKSSLMYTPVLPNSVTLRSGANVYVDGGDGKLYLSTDLKTSKGTINYATGAISGIEFSEGVKATYQYDNETVNPDATGNGAYGARMARGYLQLDEFNLVAEAMELSCYWSIYSAFAAQQEYGSNIGDIAKEAAFSEITAEINNRGFQLLEQSASYNPQFDWDASPVLTGAVVPSDYLNMFKLKLGQAAAYIYQRTRLSRPNRLVVGSNAAEYIAMINGFVGDRTQDTVGPYKLGTLDQFDIFVAPDMDPNKWVMSCKSNDIRRNSALFGEYMPLTSTDAIGLANSSVQQGYATMCAFKVVNPDTVVSGKILGTF